ncbi:phosphonate metabolism transcriptional regulator PhnF [Rhizobium sp. BK376]|uniref:phosphonate metabolism transcriptional regulator PhnF n=1 Tax=Rhizobium sp. BK376 TaxID=2512149 RepID=UPI0010DF37D2|nr:phosphonate metabolism transcriptional regulator PhnF [Rhizobium sp. BK376]TCR92981.1 GntR family transcriptional regulator [Rhizobium sp. BK376]
MARNAVVEWQELYNGLREGIEAGAFPDGSRLPSEPKLIERFGGGRHSLRRALAELAHQGLIRTEHGKGSFVQRTGVLDYRISLRTRASNNLAELGRVSSDQPVREEMVPAPQNVAAALHIETGAPVYMIVRYAFADDVPINMSVSYHPVDRFPDIDKARRSRQRLTEIYKTYGVHDYIRLKTAISTSMPTAETARVLRLPPRQPVLVTRKVDADLNGVPIAYSEAMWPGDRIQFTIDNSLEIGDMTAADAG